MPKPSDQKRDIRLTIAAIGAAATILAAIIGILPSIMQGRGTSSRGISPASVMTSPPPIPSANTSMPSPTATYSAAYLALNVNEYPTFTVYWKRALWEDVVGTDVVTEDFQIDEPDYGQLSLPYLTGNGFLLEGQSTAQILGNGALMDSGNLLQVRDWAVGLTLSFPNGTPARAFSFDFKPSETWQLSFNDSTITIPEGRKGFVGIVIGDAYPTAFVLSCGENAQGGIAIDNIAYVPRSTQ